jgi:hypothetical protein
MIFLFALIAVVQVAVQVGPVTSLATDGHEVFWATSSEIRAAPAEGGPARLVVKLPGRDDDRAASALLVTATDVVWTAGPIIWSAPRSGGRAREVGRAAQPFQGVGDVLCDGTRVYWRRSWKGKNERWSGVLLSAPVRGGPARRLAELDEAPGALALDRDHIYWAAGDAIYDMAIGGRPRLVYTDHLPDPAPGSEQAQKPRDWSGIRDVAVAAGHIYFERMGAVRRVTLDATKAEPVPELRSLAGHADDGFYQAIGPTIVRFPLEGGTPTLIASNLSDPRHVRVAGAWIYFYADGAIRRIARSP